MCLSSIHTTAHTNSHYSTTTTTTTTTTDSVNRTTTGYDSAGVYPIAVLVSHCHTIFSCVGVGSEESVDSTAQKIYAKVTRPFYLPDTKEKSSLAIRNYCYI